MIGASSLEAEARRQQLTEALTRDGSIRLAETAEQFGVSPMTIRRDLAELEALGLLRRVRGGALAARGPRSFSERHATHGPAKRLIASKALTLVPASGAIALDASSTVGHLGAAVGDRADLTIATNSWANFEAIRHANGVRAILVGGEVESHTDSFVGLIACQAAGALRYSRFFASASGIDATRGSSEVSLAEVQVKRAFAQASQSTVLCADSSKLEQTDIAQGFDWSEIEVLITELPVDDHRLDRYRAHVHLL